MLWWSWVLIWAGVVLVLLVVLALCVRLLWTKARALFAEADALSALLAELEARAAQLDAARERQAPSENAITRGVAAVDAERTELRAEIDERKLARHEARIARARRLISADPMQYADLARK